MLTTYTAFKRERPSLTWWQIITC